MIAVGCDHAGFSLKKKITEYLAANGLEYNDLGCLTAEAVDYPVIARSVAGAVTSGECEKGILVCGSGIGVSIAANKCRGIRAALCGDTFSAKVARQHNDANILAIGERVTGAGLALDIVAMFLATPFSDDIRHIQRIEMIEED